MNQSEAMLLPLGITMGDPGGVGPELCVMTLANGEGGPFVVFGDWDLLEKAAETCGLPLQAKRVSFADWQSVSAASSVLATESMVVDFQQIDADEFVPGRVSQQGGAASFAYLQEAIRAAMARRVAGIVTAPINKESLSQAGIPYPGHTEVLSDMTRTANYAMMLTSPEITCSLATTHVAFADVPRLLTSEKLVRLIELTHASLQRIKQRSEIRLTVCGLNPHAGEGGLFGDEERRIIQPAIEQARAAGFQVRGPLPPDTAFLSSVRCETDGYICMYHDQGLIPLKTLAFDEAVNVTLGLPIIRTSVDHGTAFDIAWQNRVNPSSMQAAIRLARQLGQTPVTP